MRRIEVRLDWGETPLVVGTLAEQGGRIMFEYAAEFIANPLPISPFHLPVQPGVRDESSQIFSGLHGVFNDSLPDRWGLMLMDRHFRQQGLDTSRITPLDRLAWIHTRGMGALTYHPAQDQPQETQDLLNLADLAREADSVARGEATAILPQLRLAGGSPGGARPKVIVGFNAQTGELLSGTGELPLGFEHYLIKFGSTEDTPDIGIIEYAYSLMARSAGITMTASRLFEADDGNRYFGAERFDRELNKKIHVHTLGGLLHASHRHPSLGYDGYLKATRVLTRDHRQVLQAFRRMVFNVLAGNRDDHVKNFAFLMSRSGEWQLAPAYDLVLSSGINGWHTMDVAGEAQRPGRPHMLSVATAIGITASEAEAVIDEVEQAVSMWPEFAAAAGLTCESTRRIQQQLVTDRD